MFLKVSPTLSHWQNFAALCLLNYRLNILKAKVLGADDLKSGEVPMAICVEAQGRFGMDPESGEPHENCVYSELIQLGYNSDSLASADEWGANSINFLHGLVFTDQNRPAGLLDKMHPECLKLASIIQKLKLKQATLTSEMRSGGRRKTLLVCLFPHREIGDFERKSAKAPRALVA